MIGDARRQHNQTKSTVLAPPATPTPLHPPRTLQRPCRPVHVLVVEEDGADLGVLRVDLQQDGEIAQETANLTPVLGLAELIDHHAARAVDHVDHVVATHCR